MSLPKFNPRTTILLLMIVATAVLRVVFITDASVSPLSNFSPLGAMALFGSAYFTRQWKAFAFPLVTLFLSDVFLSLTVYKEIISNINYGIWFWIYGAFALMTIAGRLLLKKITVTSVLIASVAAVFIHWIVSDIGVWLHLTTYPKTAEGFAACLIAALPYELKLLAGTLLYSSILFVSFEWMMKKTEVYEVRSEK